MNASPSLFSLVWNTVTVDLYLLQSAPVALTFALTYLTQFLWHLCRPGELQGLRGVRLRREGVGLARPKIALNMSYSACTIAQAA